LEGKKHKQNRRGENTNAKQENELNIMEANNKNRVQGEEKNRKEMLKQIAPKE
jgi:hypothetical protein